MTHYTQLTNEELVLALEVTVREGCNSHLDPERLLDLRVEILHRLGKAEPKVYPEDTALIAYALSAYQFVYTGAFPVDWSLFADNIRGVYNIVDNPVNQQVWKAVMRKAGRENELS
jgi:hypothetical protein